MSIEYLLMNPSTIQKLKDYFEQEPNILLAFLFGSLAKGRETDESDVDIGVYLKDAKAEDRIWRTIGRLIEKEVDLITLSNAPATLVSNVFKTGIPLTIKDRRLYWRLYLSKSLESEDFTEFLGSYWEIYQRSKSLILEDKARLFERIEYVESELREKEFMSKITFEEYQKDKIKRRNVERWTENIVNAIIDIAKIILASRKERMPKTYEEALYGLGDLTGLKKEDAERLSKLASVRNILAHEYLHILYGEIRNFIEAFPPLYEKVSEFLKQYLENKKTL